MRHCWKRGYFAVPPGTTSERTVGVDLGECFGKTWHLENSLLLGPEPCSKWTVQLYSTTLYNVYRTRTCSCLKRNFSFHNYTIQIGFFTFFFLSPTKHNTLFSLWVNDFLRLIIVTTYLVQPPQVWHCIKRCHFTTAFIIITFWMTVLQRYLSVLLPLNPPFNPTPLSPSVCVLEATPTRPLISPSTPSSSSPQKKIKYKDPNRKRDHLNVGNSISLKTYNSS